MSSQDTTLPTAAPAAKSGHRARASRRIAVVGALIVSLGAAWYGYERFRTAPLRNLPEVNLSQAHPAVRRAIESAQAAVRAAPRSGPAWGELGLYLRAHELDCQANICLGLAMRFDPQEVLWPYVRGSSLSVRDRPQAERCFRLAARLRPDLALPR